MARDLYALQLDDETGALAVVVDYVNEAVSGGDFKKSELINRVIDEFRGSAEFQKLADYFLYTAIETMVSKSLHKKRTDAARAARSSLFTHALRSHDEGNGAPLASWLEAQYRTETGVYLTLGNMTKADCRYVANNYRTAERSAMFRAVFLETIANGLNTNDRVGDKYTDEVLRDIWNSIENR